LAEEQGKIEQLVGAENYENGRFETAVQLLDQLISEETFTDFLTLPGYGYLA
jgi:malate synthase